MCSFLNLSRDLIDMILFFVCSAMKAKTTLTVRPITRSVLKATPTLAVRAITSSVMKVVCNQ